MLLSRPRAGPWRFASWCFLIDWSRNKLGSDFDYRLWQLSGDWSFHSQLCHCRTGGIRFCHHPSWRDYSSPKANSIFEKWE